ncbi:riboflavin transporter 2 [Pangasianodon hypophthalmus]|uniref:riboflavin transporter 2 n=1 Tax=Pangasianodon hypophthalmus TaxID=310915 RepID=UPI002307FF98|nr:riboflavin transporter 2 [Pangasianodon hypophthalmus]
MSLLTHILACLFGMGSWVTICGLWVELPLIVPQVPEGWYLPSYLSILTQAANVGPLFVTLMHQFQPGKLNETAVIYFIVSFGTLSSLLLAFFWKATVVVQGVERSIYLLILTFFISTVDCTSSVTFLPFMMQLKPEYLTSYYVGEGLSGLIPAVVALIQGVGVLQCVEGTQNLNPNETINGSLDSTNHLIPHYLPANFSAKAFFFFLAAMMFVCLVAFLLLNNLPVVARERSSSLRYQGAIRNKDFVKEKKSRERKPMMNSPNGIQKFNGMFGKGTYSWAQILYIFIILAWVNALTNSVLLSVQSYSCLPYGNHAYHWSATMASIANPLACFIAMFYAQRSLVLMGFLTAFGTVFGIYIMAMAVLSPCPLLVNHISGAILIVAAWTFFVLTLSYVKVIIAVILRDEGHSALVWCGAVVQLGSLLGAVIMFPLVNVYNFFSSGDPCNSTC